MKQAFSLRVDVESYRGIREGLPKLLDLLKKHSIKASFYLTMGGESNILELIRYRGRMKSSSQRGIKIWSLKDKLRMIFFPKDFVEENLSILRRIINEGHELGLHGWKHREWTRGLDKINIKNRIKKSIKKYKKLFRQKPISWASPGFNVNDIVLKCLEENGIKYISDFEGKSVKKYGKIKNIPITICGRNRMPFIEYLVGLRKSDKEILDIFKKESKGKKIVSVYIHDLFEARFKLSLLEEIIKFLKKSKLKNKRVIDY